MSDAKAIGAAARTIRDIQHNGHDPLWRASALDACRQECNVYTAARNIYAAMLVGAVILMVEHWAKEALLASCDTGGHMEMARKLAENAAMRGQVDDLRTALAHARQLLRIAGRVDNWNELVDRFLEED